MVGVGATARSGGSGDGDGGGDGVGHTSLKTQKSAVCAAANAAKNARSAVMKISDDAPLACLRHTHVQAGRCGLERTLLGVAKGWAVVRGTSCVTCGGAPPC